MLGIFLTNTGQSQCLRGFGTIWTDNQVMLIIAIAWLYVVLMMSLTQTSFIAGVATFLFYGLIPCSIVLYIVNTPARRSRAKRKEAEQVSDNPEQNGGS